MDRNIDKNIEKDDFYSKNTYIEEPWSLIKSYFKNKHLEQLVKHQIESYNEFVNNQLYKTIDMFNPLNIVSVQDYNEDLNKYRLEIIIHFKNICMYRPEIHENNGATKLMFPSKARLRNFTYSSNINADIHIQYLIRKGDKLEQEESILNVLPKIHLGKLPIMLKSSLCVLNQYKHMNNKLTDECPMDTGGYFIINGQEKTCLGQEKTADNKIFVYKNKKSEKHIAIAEIKCVPDWKVISPKQVSMFVSSKLVSSGHEIFINIPRIKKEIPLFILFRLLGIETDKDICSKIVLNIDNNKSQKILNYISGCIVSSYTIKTKEDAINYLIKNIHFNYNVSQTNIYEKKREYIKEIINNDLFPHCKTNEEKIYLLGYMTHKLVSVSLNFQEPDDRDSYINKRIETTGVLINNLFRNYFNKLVRDMNKLILREVNNGSWKSNEDFKNIINMTNIYKIIKTSTIENGIKRALATGDFGIKMMNTNKVGVAQVLNRLTYVSSLSHLRRVNNPIDRTGKLVDPRKLHGSSWGFLCPAETPEGQSVGIVKNLSSLTNITGYSESNVIEKYIEPYITKLSIENTLILYDKVKIFLNGRWLGIVNEAIELYKDLKYKKSIGLIHIYTSIIFNYEKKEIYIYNDCGRLIRPLLKVKNNRLLLTRDIISKLQDNTLQWNDLFLNHKIPESVLEYIDCEQQAYEMICMKPSDLKENDLNKNIYNYTLCEIHPSSILGVLASCIPFPEHNQSPRNTYQCAMGKQAIGIHVKNFDKRMDRTSYVLNYGMKPLVETRLMNMLELSKMPSGNQLIVAIMSYTGFNQEDSILVNKSSIERGMLQATIYHTEKDEDKKINGEEEIRTKPDKSKTKNIKFANYDKINKDGLIDKDTLVENRDVIIAKVISIKQNKNDNTKVIKYEDQSKIFRTNEKCYIDGNSVSRNGEGYKSVKSRIRNTRQPVIGDKFSSRHGQKGTVGNIIPEENMPFTKDGLVPDIIINPHAIPSRMTIAQLKESLLGKVLIQLGLFGDGTSFGELSIKTIIKKLKEFNYESKGNELLYNGMTGEQIETSIFIGPVFYQRLKHMVNDKQHSRDIGPMVNLTRQPPEGRSRDGGLRIGEMERDCIVAHGASRFVKDRLYDVSDKYSIHVCKKCGMFASYNEKESISCCNVCDNTSSFAKVDIPYSCKLLFQELISMNIAPRIITE